MIKVLKFLLVAILCFGFIDIQARADNIPAYQVEVVLDTKYYDIQIDDDYIYAFQKVGEHREIYDSGFPYMQKDFAFALYDKDMNMLSPPLNQVDEWDIEKNLNRFSENALKVKRDDKYGYLDTSGALFIDAVYDEAENFCNGFARVKKDEKWGVINFSGDTVIDFIYSYIGDFSDGKAIAQKDGFMGVLDIGGGFLALPYKYLSEIKNGYIFACMDTVMGQSWGDVMDLYIYAPAEDIKNNFGFIDVEGNKICPFTLGARWIMSEPDRDWNGDSKVWFYFHAGYFNEDGYAIVTRGEKFGIMGIDGRLVNGFTLDDMMPDFYTNEYFTSNGLEPVNIGDKYGIINSKGELVQDFKYDYIHYVWDLGIFECRIDDQKFCFEKNGLDEKFVYTGSELNYNFDYYIIIHYNQKNGHYQGIMGLDGEMIIKPSHLNILGYNGKNAIVYYFNRREYELFNVETGKTIYKGHIKPISDERLYIKRDDASYLADWDGNILSEVDWNFYFNIYDFYYYKGQNEYNIVYVRCKNDGAGDGDTSSIHFFDGDEYIEKYGVIDKFGNIVIEPIYPYLNDYSTYYVKRNPDIFIAHNYDRRLDEDEGKTIYSLPENLKKREYFDVDSNLIFYSTGGCTYSADNRRIYNKDIDFVEDLVNKDNYFLIEEYNHFSSKGLMRITKNAEAGDY